MKKNVQEMRDQRLSKILWVIIILCIVIVVIEGCVFLYVKNKQEQNTVYYDAFQMSASDGDRIVAVGSSDFRKSKLNPYTDGIEKGRLAVFDKNGEIQLEVQYDKGIASTFTSVLVIDDGYLVTGSGEYSDYQRENHLRDAFLIKYDKSGNKIWEKYYGVLSNTRFNKVIQTSDGYVVIGQSLYESMEVGNHTTGGGVIVKYDFDGNEVWHNNHGGNKSGNFNGIVEVKGNFYVVGKDAADSGNLIKFDKNGKYVWHKNYSYTDSLGFQDIAYLNDRLYVVGSKKILKDENAEDRTTDNTDAILISYDMKGNIKKEELFGGSKKERFNDIEVMDDHLYLIGVSNSLDSDLKIELEESEEEITSGFMMVYDQDFNRLNSVTLGGTKNDVVNHMTTSGNQFYVSGYFTSKDGNISSGNNGKDYFGKALIFQKDLSFEVIK